MITSSKERGDMSSRTQVEEIVKSIEDLPPFPDAGRRILELSDDPEAGPKDMVDVIQYDQALTANCLKVCNSTYFGLAVKVSAIQQAVRLLGIQNIVKIVLASFKGLHPYLKAHSGYGLHSGELWKHSVGCATLSQLLLKEVGRKDDAALFTAALLHDVGKMILDRYVAENLNDLASVTGEKGLAFIEAEKEVLGIDHAEVGAMVAESWRFPDALVKAIGNHHQSMSGEIMPTMDAWVRLSNLMYYVSLAYVYCSQYKGISCKVDQAILFQFGFNQEKIDKVLAKYPMEVRKAQEMLNLTGAS
jgi:putative nucleotidyltransferase with HDIG domain